MKAVEIAGTAPPHRPSDRSTGPATKPSVLHDLKGIRERDLTSQIVVDTPGDTGTDDRERALNARDIGVPVHARIAAPTTRQAMPRPTRKPRSRGNDPRDQCGRALSTVSRSEAVAASVCASPP